MQDLVEEILTLVSDIQRRYPELKIEVGYGSVTIEGPQELANKAMTEYLEGSEKLIHSRMARQWNG